VEVSCGKPGVWGRGGKLGINLSYFASGGFDVEELTGHLLTCESEAVRFRGIF